jgi:hypothetical protein
MGQRKMEEGEGMDKESGGRRGRVLKEGPRKCKKGREGEEAARRERERKKVGQLELSPVDDDALHAGDEPRIETPHDPVSLKICLI